MAKKLDLDINTDSFLESIRPELPPSSAQKKETEKTEVELSDTVREKQRKIQKPIKSEMTLEDEFMELFIRSPDTAARSGKTAYIRPEYHDRIMRITRVIGKNKLSLSAYLDHVLTHHFAMFEEAIRKQYKKNYEDVY